MPTRILAQRYNDLRDRINKILGAPTDLAPNFGYGQTLTSSAVSAEVSKIKSADYVNLVSDMSKARYHQIGSSFGGISPVIPTGANREKVFEKYIEDLELLMPDIESDSELVATSQTTIESIKNSAGASLVSVMAYQWNSSINYTFDLEFTSEAHYRSFFNTSSEIRISTSSNYTGTESKSVEWKSALNYISTIRFTKDQTIAANGAIVNANGGRDLTVGTKVTLINTGNFSSPYSSNRIKLEVTKTTVSKLRFTITLTDAAVTWPSVDENVKGVITTTVSVLRANGSLSKINMAAPIGRNIETYSIPTVTVTYEIIGGGGGGGFGVDDHGEEYRGTYASSGTESIMSGTGITTVTAAGGAGGENCKFDRGSVGEAGQASFYGAGGAGGALNQAGGSAPSTSYGAGGGGGGGDDGSFWDAGGCAGGGGSAGTRKTGTFTVLYGTTVNITIGTPGAGGTLEYNGGAGRQGCCKLTYNGSTHTITQTGGIIIQ